MEFVEFRETTLSHIVRIRPSRDPTDGRMSFVLKWMTYTQPAVSIHGHFGTAVARFGVATAHGTQ